jgi:hypothetical protein
MIERVAYQPNARVLDLIFRDGKIYSHFLVPRAIVVDLNMSHQSGALYNTRIRGRCEMCRLR